MGKLYINGEQVSASEFAYDGCHKIYLIANDEGRRNVEGYDIYPASRLPDVWKETCWLRFISPADLNSADLVAQGEEATVEYR